ncbi:glycoside hydrolase family 130 protein [Paenibacillus hamazuiensis]|uniref:glycoside hydrolase family 130 protein n=1 Tax=Paenibacillus hamazuiensis TaxID=2936508 RepID=UPI002010A2A4|nr:glycoside hydrolase family 130 protein [Paenibacillus hamazuiensis]
MIRYPVNFPLGPFRKYRKNPILEPQGESWEAKDVFNPAAVVKDGAVYLLYRAEDRTGAGSWHGTSRIGLARSEDGVRFERLKDPVLMPTEAHEQPGGCEDPRVTWLEGTYYMTYTAFDGETARLCLATSRDLENWEKKGLMLPGWNPGERCEWSKSGAIVPMRLGGRMVMYFGDTDIWIAYSDDGVRWEPQPEPVMRRSPDPEAFDSELIEPGPAPILTEEGILLVYNGAKRLLRGKRRNLLYYSVGQALFSYDDPAKLLRRTERPVFAPSTASEKKGQIDDVVFAEGLVFYRGVWRLYYGMADSRIGLATFSAR